MKEFPVGTGIYRSTFRATKNDKRVPCRYRDIPSEMKLKNEYMKSSL